MKKTLAISLAVLMIFSMTACVKRIDKPDEEQTAQTPPKSYEEMTLEEKLEYKASFEREYAATGEINAIAPAKDPETGSFGYINNFGEWVIQPQYAYAYSFSEDIAPIIDQYNSYAYANRDGSVFMTHYSNKAGFAAVRHFYEHFAAAVIDAGYEQSKIYIGVDGISQLSAAKLPTTEGVKYEQKQLFMIASPFKNGNAVTMRRTNASVLEANDNNREKVSNKGYYQSAYIINGVGDVEAELPAGLDAYDYSLNSNRTVIVRDMRSEDMPYGVCDIEGNIIIPCKYKYIEYCENDLFMACDSDGFFGYLDKNGKTVIDFQYINAKPFSEGLAAVSVMEGWGVIDTNGDYVIEPCWDDFANLKVSDYDFNIGKAAFSEGVAAVRKGDFWALIDSANNILDVTYAPDAESCPYTGQSYGFVVYEEYKEGASTGLFGLLDIEGHGVLRPEFKYIGLFS